MEHKPKEKILSLPSEYITIGLVGLFILSVLGGIIFIASKTQSSQTTSLPIASGESALTTQTNKQIPNPLPSQAPLGPQQSSTKPKVIVTPKPTVKSTPSPSPSTTPSSTPAPTSTPNPGAKVVNLSMDPSSSTKTVNETFTVALKIDPGSDKVSAVELHIKFDQAKLEVQSFTAGSLMSVLTPESHNNSDGTASITLGSPPSSPVTSSGTLATITFKALTSGSGAVSYASNTETASVGRTGNSLNNSTGSIITIN